MGEGLSGLDLCKNLYRASLPNTHNIVHITILDPPPRPIFHQTLTLNAQITQIHKNSLVSKWKVLEVTWITEHIGTKPRRLYKRRVTQTRRREEERGAAPTDLPSTNEMDDVPLVSRRMNRHHQSSSDINCVRINLYLCYTHTHTQTHIT